MFLLKARNAFVCVSRLSSGLSDSGIWGRFFFAGFLGSAECKPLSLAPAPPLFKHCSAGGSWGSIVLASD
uniref:Uncharacterized protein n=1 Tax=Anguilla anguilla TaxID=7936 RepID=A0A0E9UTV6_ANGAN